MSKFKKDFPIFKKRKQPFVYLDSGSTSQKPQTVIDSISNFYSKTNANVHRGIYKLSEEATALYEGAREKVSKFINAKNASEIIFTGNTNEAINLVAFGYAKKFLKSGDIVVLSEMEHHANIVPWIKLKEELGIILYYLPIDKDYRLNYQTIIKSGLDLNKVKLIALTQASNVLGTINPIKEIIKFFKELRINAKFLIDAAQSAPHLPIDVQALNCDFLAFSPHKMLGPTGIGVLWGRKELLEKMDPLFFGSHMISKVTKEKAEWTEIPWKFEVGTGKLEAAVGLGAAINYINNVGMQNILEHERELTKYGLEQLQKVEGLTLYGPRDSKDRLAIFSFNFKDAHAHDVAQILDSLGICIRSGHQCAQPLMDILGVSATARASLYFYNEKVDIDALVEGLKLVKKTLKI